MHFVTVHSKHMNIVCVYKCCTHVCTSTPHLLVLGLDTLDPVHVFPLYAGVNKQKKKLIIMRGLPGSGKSTLARFVTHCAQVYVGTHLYGTFGALCVCVWHSLQGFEGEDWSHLFNRRFLLSKWTVRGHTYVLHCHPITFLQF